MFSRYFIEYIQKKGPADWQRADLLQSFHSLCGGWYYMIAKNGMNLAFLAFFYTSEWQRTIFHFAKGIFIC